MKVEQRVRGRTRIETSESGLLATNLHCLPMGTLDTPIQSHQAICPDLAVQEMKFATAIKFPKFLANS